MDIETRIIELAQMGYECSQILMIMAMELEGTENPELIRAMSGLNRGMGSTGKTCGCLSAGSCVLGFYGGKGEEEEIEASGLHEAIGAYVRWFEEETGSRYGGTDCEKIVHGNYALCMTTCMPILTSCMEKLMELLETYKLDVMPF